LLVLVILLPVTFATLSLSGSAITLGQHLSESKNGAEALKALSTGEAAGFDPKLLDPQHIVDLIRQHGATALRAARSIFGAASVALIGLVVFVAGFYTFLTEGKPARDWLLERSPLSHAHFHRFGNVFAEAGRGLLVGVGLTALAQGAVATVGYLLTGVPQALVLGLVTVFASLIPSVGSALVWVPVTAGLALTGRPGAALAMLLIGLFVSVVDNLLRPLFARYAELRLHSLALFVAMLGGIMLFGTWGLLLGPLLVRWASEGLSMLREQRAEVRDQ
jgi:predicted PurR-regulated permease PerM